jgi:hypothetical protein
MSHILGDTIFTFDIIGETGRYTPQSSWARRASATMILTGFEF